MTNWWAGSGISSDIGIIICSNTGWRLDIELGERWVHRNGHCFYWNGLPRFRCLCYQLTHLWLHPMQPKLHVNLKLPSSYNLSVYRVFSLVSLYLWRNRLKKLLMPLAFHCTNGLMYIYSFSILLVLQMGGWRSRFSLFDFR